MSFASGRIILVAVLPQTGDKGVSGMRSLPSDIPQDAPRPFSKAAGVPSGVLVDFDERERYMGVDASRRV